MNPQKKVILITGASSGIGLTCAEYLSSRGNLVYGIGRNPDFKTTEFTYYPVDVRNEPAVQSLVSQILEKEKRIDVLINNAGIHVAGAIEHIDHQRVLELFDCNFFGYLNMIRSILPGMKKRKSGLLICISSIAGVTGLPFQGIYCASKFALEGLCESLRMETHHSGVHVVLVEPGDFKTAITQNRTIDPLTVKDPFYAGNFETTMKKVTLDESTGANAIDIARLIENIMCMRRPGVRYTAGHKMQRVVPFLKRIVPSAFFEFIIRKNYYS